MQCFDFWLVSLPVKASDGPYIVRYPDSHPSEIGSSLISSTKSFQKEQSHHVNYAVIPPSFSSTLWQLLSQLEQDSSYHRMEEVVKNATFIIIILLHRRIYKPAVTLCDLAPSSENHNFRKLASDNKLDDNWVNFSSM